MNDKRFRKYCSFSIFLSLLGMFELEAKEEQKEERKTERKKEKNAQHTLGKVTTQAAKIFKPPKQKSQISLVFGMNALVPLGTIKTLSKTNLDFLYTP